MWQCNIESDEMRDSTIKALPFLQSFSDSNCLDNPPEFVTTAVSVPEDTDDK